MAFKGTITEGQAPANPEDLYIDLPRRRGAVPGLWSHQVDLLRLYMDEHQDTSDLAIELPTGTGKTLTGLLLAEWVRRHTGKRVLYACPTKQLVKQVQATADREGVKAVTLIGSHQNWPMPDQTAFEAAEKIAIVTYSTIFNSNPHVEVSDLIIFDDAHAGEQYVGESYAIDIKRGKNRTEYFEVLQAIRPALDGVFANRLEEDYPDASINESVRLVVPSMTDGMLERLDATLASLDKFKFDLAVIRSGLAACLAYVSYGGILIRPVIPPTSNNKIFARARQRIYLSATLGVGGEIERAFGREQISRLRLPDTAPTPRSGRRFFVFPELMTGVDPVEVTKQIVARAGKALVLGPETGRAIELGKKLAEKDWPVLGIDEVADGMQPFADLEKGICALASRYDGIDLPDDACRVVVLDGKPDQDSLQERFLYGRAKAGAAIAERVRTRVVQGAGRATRQPNDAAIVVILDRGLTKYLQQPETINALEPDLQAEIQFGRRNSTEVSVQEVLGNVDAFLDQGETWRSGAEPHIAKARRQAVQNLPEGSDALGRSVQYEVEACGFAATSQWDRAAAKALEAARIIGSGGNATRGYRAVWLYLAGVWTELHAASEPGAHATAGRLIGQAENTAEGTWTREMPTLATVAPHGLAPADASAVTKIVSILSAGVNVGRHNRQAGEMLAGLSQRDPGKYEPALTALGKLLGAEAQKPPAKGRCDSTWCWENHLWLAMEAKSDHELTGVISHKEVRQANDQLQLLASDRGHTPPPPGSATIIISPKPGVDIDGVKGAHTEVHHVGLLEVERVANDTVQAWSEILAAKDGRTPAQLSDLVGQTMAGHGLLPTQVSETLTSDPVAAD
ncbi:MULTISPECIES: DEAD/DEAH box helicase family protein [unclassified Plantibacter]|uniref:DEAD/DEAH box helicase family protein n=1 Tax=unclassified Plantibacter TaxID=2624265 RepID=UPI0009EBE92D|nr:MULTISPECIES: DEAD/DEAH box helicase family protein [unclassified Plantibacter]